MNEIARVIGERICCNTATAAEWAAFRMVRSNAVRTDINRLYADYESWCYDNKLAPLSRKTWIAALKLADFQVESGAFLGLELSVDE